MEEQTQQINIRKLGGEEQGKLISESGRIAKKVLLISLCNYQLFSIRILHSIIKDYTDVKTVFLKRYIFTTDNARLYPTEKEYNLLMNLIKKYKPDLVGISVRSMYFDIAKDLTNRIRNTIKTTIMWGGIHPIINPEECIKEADIICISEGEIPIKNYFENNIKDGFWYKEKDKIIRNPKRVLEENLDKIPLPYFGHKNKYYIEENKIVNGDPLKECRVYSVMASRGCPFNCSYCINSNLRDLYKGYKFLRLRGVDNVIEELKLLKKHNPNIRRILFVDEIFGLGNQIWMNEFVVKYKKEIKLPFGMEYRPDMITDKIENTFKLLKDAGMDNLLLGIESVSERVRNDIYNRKVSDTQIIECQKILKRIGFLGAYNIIVNNPLETIEDLKKGFDFVMKLDRPYSLHIFKLVNFPNTELTKIFIEKGLIDEKNIKENKTFMFSPSKDSEEDFWINMISLTSKEFIPKFCLILLSKTNSSTVVYYITRVSNIIKLGIDGLKYMSREGLSYDFIRTILNNFKGYLKIYR